MANTLLVGTLDSLIADKRLSDESKTVLNQLKSRLDGLTPKQENEAYGHLFKLQNVISMPRILARMEFDMRKELMTFLNTLDSLPVQDTPKKEDSNHILLERLIDMLDEEKLKLLNKREKNRAYLALHDYCDIVLNDLKHMPPMDPQYLELEHFKNLEIESKKMRGTGLENLCLLIKNFFILLSKGEKPTFEKLSLTATAKECERIKASAHQFFAAGEAQETPKPTEGKTLGFD
ncbi:MAG: hypothetical protein ACOYKA_00045 [Legionellaceae bacterium]